MIKNIVITALLVLLMSYILPGVHVDDFWSALGVAIGLGFANILVKPLLSLFAFPLTVMTLGLFQFVINALVVLFVDWLVGDGFNVAGFWWAMLFSIVLSFLQTLVAKVIQS